MTPAQAFQTRDAIMSAWRTERDPERKATLLTWADAVGTMARQWTADRARLTNLQTEAFAAAPRVPAGGFGVVRGVMRPVANVVSFHAEMAARCPT